MACREALLVGGESSEFLTCACCFARVNPSYKAAIGPAAVAAAETEGGSEKKYPKFVFGDYMDVYANQKFMPKEPRFLAVKSL